MKQKKDGEFRSAVYENRPAYADFDAPDKFQAIQGIIMTHLSRHPKAICSYSGGSDSDIMIDLIEHARQIIPTLPKVKYVFFDTGLEMEATKRHVRETAEKYGVEIETCRPKKNIVLSTKEHGLPWMSKIVSTAMETVQKKEVPFEIADEYAACETDEERKAKREELRERYPKAETAINFLCECDSAGNPRPGIQLSVGSSPFLLDFFKETPPTFRMSATCCVDCKKNLAHAVQKDYEMVITGERRDEGGMRSVPRSGDANQAMCFSQTSSGQYRFRPLYYVSDADKAWYKDWRRIRYSDAYEVYGLKRTGCCGCSISSRAAADLEIIGRYEPNIKKAAWHIFGASYRYRQAYEEYKRRRYEEQKNGNQTTIFDELEWSKKQ